MSENRLAPRRLGRWPSFCAMVAFARDPLVVTRRLYEAYGPHVELQYPNSTAARPHFLGCIADAELYRGVFADPEAWRSVNYNFRGFKNHASRRLVDGMTRFHGIRHSYYRKLMTPPLSRPAVTAMSPDMAALAMRQVAAWPRGIATPLAQLTGHLTQDLAVGLLFGDERERARPIAAMIERQVDNVWPSRLFGYAKWLLKAPQQERMIMEWAERKRGNLDPKDILSIIVNNPDEYGNRVTRERIGGLVSFTFGAAYETCQNALLWTLILLTQHPKIAAALTDEIRGAMNGGLPTMDRIGALPLLDGVMKEGMRLFPPIPFQSRRSMKDTTLAGNFVKSGTRYIACAFLISRNPDMYPEPERFRPERWATLNPSPYDYAVFGAGGRMCPGFTFAGQMVKTSLAAILSQHRIGVAPGAQIDYRVSLTLAPHPAVPIVLHDVGDAPATVRAGGRFRELVQIPDAA